MSKRSIGIILLLVFCLLPVALYAQAKDEVPSEKGIMKIIGEKTPDFIAKPIIYLVDAIEAFRVETGASVDVQKQTTEKEVDNLNANNKNGSLFAKYLLYAQLYFIIIWAYIFNNALWFYIILLTLIFILLRYTIRLFRL